MTQYLNAHNLKYIWFGPMPLLNLERLRTVRRDNPQADISLTISREKLTPNQFADIYRFCKLNRIQLITTEDLNEKIQLSTNKFDKQLMAIIHQELHDPHGNPAGASDVLRSVSHFWMESGGSGVYLDLDTTAKVPKEKWISLKNANPYLLPAYTVATTTPSENVSNDIIAMTTPFAKKTPKQEQHISRCLQPVQEKILARYESALMIFIRITQNTPMMVNYEILKHITKKIIDSTDGWKKPISVFLIRSLIGISFEEHCYIALNTFKKITISALLQKYPNTKDFMQIKKDLERSMEADYKDVEARIKESINKKIQNFIIDYLSGQSMAAKKRYHYFDLDLKEISVLDLLKMFHKINIEHLYVNFLMATGGVEAWMDLAYTPLSEIEKSSLYQFGLGVHYIAQGGEHKQFVRTAEEEQKNHDNLPDNSWISSGKNSVQSQSEEIAKEKLTRLFLPKALQKIRAKLLKKQQKQKNPFLIKRHETPRAPALLFMHKKEQNPSDIKVITIRNETFTQTLNL